MRPQPQTPDSLWSVLTPPARITGRHAFFFAPQPSVSKHPLAPILQGAASVLPSSLELRRRVAPCNVFDIIKGQSCNRARHVNCSLMGHVGMWQFLIIKAVPRQGYFSNKPQRRSTHEGQLTQLSTESSTKVQTHN